MATIHTLLSWSEEILIQADVPSPRTDAEWALIHVLNCSRSYLHVNPDQILTSGQGETFRDLIHRRAKRIPLQHVLEQTEFYGLPFYTSPDALIPRPDTETLIETVVQNAPDHSKILDIGTGSGIIAITLAHKLPNARVFATDISRKALHLARRNAHLNRVSDCLTFVQTDLVSSFNKPFDIIVSNPPYIPTKDIATLEPEVRIYDPIKALDGGVDGLDFYRKIIPASLTLLSQGGFLCFEIGHDQTSDVSDLLDQHATLGNITVFNDLSRHPRVVFAQKQK